MSRPRGYFGLPRDVVLFDGKEPVDVKTGVPTDSLSTLRLPAAGAYLSVLRTATASLASRLDFTIDDIEDLRIAVDEACAMLLVQAVPGADLECSFELTSDAIRVTVTVPTLDGKQPSRDTFAWTVLTALAGEVDSSVDADRLVTLVLRKRRGELDDVAAT